MAKKKNAYGKRYTDVQKAAMIKLWQANLSKSKPQSKMGFCKDQGITTITLDAWLRAAHGTTKVKPARVVEPEPEILSERAIIVAGEPMAVAIAVEDSVADLVRAIKEYQANIDALKGQLRQWVETL